MDHGGTYYLRRASDPDMGHGVYSMYTYAACPAEATAWWCAPTYSHGKECPSNGQGGYNCLNNNFYYNSLQAAWTACATVSGCGQVVEVTGSPSEWYLRRTSDPDNHEGGMTMTSYTACCCWDD